MRGHQTPQEVLFSYVNLEERIPDDHPLRAIKALADQSLKMLSPQFDQLYAKAGRPSIPPEMLIKAILLQILYGIRSEIQLMQQVDFNLLYRWFVGLGVDDRAWTPEVFSANRDRLFSKQMAAEFFRTVVVQARKKGLVSAEHFSVDGTLLKAWASQKSFQVKGKKRRRRKDPGDFRGESRTNDTHESVTDPEARLYRKSPGSASELCFMAHTLMENRHGLAVDGEVTRANPKEERDSAIRMLGRRRNPRARVTAGADKGYDVNDFHEQCRSIEVTPHVAKRDDGRDNVLDGRTTRHVGYAISGVKRKCIEMIHGWVKSTACVRQVKVRGQARVEAVYLFCLSMFDMVRISNLCKESP
jgi:transposase